MVRISTHLLPVIGRICMDQLAIDLTGADDVSVGDTAILIDNAENAIFSLPTWPLSPAASATNCSVGWGQGCRW